MSLTSYFSVEGSGSLNVSGNGSLNTETPAAVSGSGAICVLSNIDVGDVIDAVVTWTNYPTGKVRLETKTNTGKLYSVITIRGDVSSGTDYIIIITNHDGTNWNQFSSDAYSSSVNPFVSNNSFTIRMTKSSATESLWEVIDNSDDSVFFTKTALDEEPEEMDNIDQFCINPTDSAEINYTLSKTPS